MLRSLEVRGFKAFREVQSIFFSPGLNLIYGDNSRGKTSLVEGLELLLSGDIQRTHNWGDEREHANSLINVGFSPSRFSVSEPSTWKETQAYVQLRVGDNDEEFKTATAIVIQDIGANRRHINKRLPDDNLETQGLGERVLSQWALKAFVTQSGSRRGDSFRRLLGLQACSDAVKQLEKLRALQGEHPISPPARTTTVSLLEHANEIGDADLVSLINAANVSERDFIRIAVRTASSLMKASGDPARLDPEECSRLEAMLFVNGVLATAREEVVPVMARLRTEATPNTTRLQSKEVVDSALVFLDGWLAELQRLADDQANLVTSLASLNDLVEQYTSEMPLGLASELRSDIARIYQAFGASKYFQEYSERASVRCPVCLEETLTTERIGELVDFAQNMSPFARALSELGEKISDLTLDLEAETKLSGLRLKLETSETSALNKILGAETAVKLVERRAALTNALGEVSRMGTEVLGILKSALNAVQTGSPFEPELARDSIRALGDLQIELAENLESYLRIYSTVEGDLIRARDEARSTKVAELLHTALNEYPALQLERLRTRTYEDYVQELRDVSDAISRNLGDVCDREISGLSAAIKAYWELLRPESIPSLKDFGSRRTADDKYALDGAVEITVEFSVEEGKTERHALGVFSESQANCLALALHCARAEVEDWDWVVFDDPIQSLDSEHRARFVDHVIPKLRENGKQVILLTHDNELRQHAQIRFNSDADFSDWEICGPRGAACVRPNSTSLCEQLRRVKENATGDSTARKNGGTGLRRASEFIAKCILHKKGSPVEEITRSFGKGLLRDVGKHVDPGEKSTIEVAWTLAGDPGSHQDPIIPDEQQLKDYADRMREIASKYLT